MFFKLDLGLEKLRANSAGIFTSLFLLDTMLGGFVCSFYMPCELLSNIKVLEAGWADEIFRRRISLLVQELALH